MIPAFPLLPNLLPTAPPTFAAGDMDGFADLFAEDGAIPAPEVGALPLVPPSHIVLPQFDGVQTEGAVDLVEPADGGALPKAAPDMAPSNLPVPQMPVPVAPPETVPPPSDTPLPDPVVQKTQERLTDLAPDDDLGPLQVTVEREGDQIRIVLTAERAETLDLMRRHADQLLADLAREGLGTATFTFAHRDGGEESAPPPDATHIDITARTTASGLDLRL